MLRKRIVTAPPSRRGFSLIELLVVMAIITALVAITAAAVFKGFTWAAISNTQTLMGKIDKRLVNRNDKIRRDAIDIDVPVGLGSLGFNQRQARVIQQKLFIKYSFPRCFREAMLNYWQSRALYAGSTGSTYGYSFAGQIWKKIALSFRFQADYSDPNQFAYPNNPASVPAWPTSDTQAIAENSACLAIVLELLGSLDELAPSERATLLFDLTNQDSQSTPAQLPVIIDGWGTGMMYDYAPGNPHPTASPVRFNYWTTQFGGLRQRAALAFPAKFPAPPGSANSDPDDPEGLIANLQSSPTNPNWQTLDTLFNLQASYWSITFNPGPPNGTDSNPANRYPQFGPPILLSAGPDKTFGFQNGGGNLGNAASNALDDLDSYSWRVTTQGQ